MQIAPTWFAVACVLFMQAFTLAAEAEPLAESKFPVIAYVGPPANEQAYRDLAAAGFTGCITWAANVDEVAKHLDCAHSAGVTLIIASPELTSDTKGFVARFKGHAALAGYYLTDEPSAARFDDLGATVRQLKELDSTRPSYVNLLPTYASTIQLGAQTYREHLDQYLQKVPTPFISFDHYPITVNDQPRADYFDNLEQVAAAGARAGRPVWAFVLSVGIRGAYPVPTLPGMRYQAFSNLAYGVQAMQLFTYWTPNPTHEQFHDAPYTIDGQRTPVYDLVRRVIGEIQARRDVFLNARVVSVAHTGETLPSGTTRYAPTGVVHSLKTTGAGAVVSLLAKGEGRSLVIVNRDVKGTMGLKVGFDAATSVQAIDRSGKSQPMVEGRAFEGTVEPGDAAIFTWQEKAR